MYADGYTSWASLPNTSTQRRPAERSNHLARIKAVTLIVGLRCIDGFLIAADTAISDGDIVMYHGQKIEYQIGRDHRIVIACAGDLPYAQTATRQIKNTLLSQTADLDVPKIINLIEQELIDVHCKHIYPFWEAKKEPAPEFSLIIGVESHGLFTVLSTQGTNVTTNDRYVFDGAGHTLARDYAEAYVRSRQNDSIALYTATAMHIVDEIFRVVKKFRSGVGLDTRIYAWRTDASPSGFYLLSEDQKKLFAILQENLKSAIWAALETTSSDHWFTLLKDKPPQILAELREAAKQAQKFDSRFVCYTSMPQYGEASMVHLDYSNHL